MKRQKAKNEPFDFDTYLQKLINDGVIKLADEVRKQKSMKIIDARCGA